jgi:transaldolase
MKATQLLHNMGQSIWLDNITRALLTSGTLRKYIDELSVTGLTSNPTIFDCAISKSTDYDSAIQKKLGEGKFREGLFFGALGAILPPDGGDCEAMLGKFAQAGLDVDKLAATLQDEGAKSFVASWKELMECIESKSAAIKKKAS